MANLSTSICRKFGVACRMALEPCSLWIQPPQTFMWISYAHTHLARGPQLTVRFIGLAAFTVAFAHRHHGLVDRQQVIWRRNCS